MDPRFSGKQAWQLEAVLKLKDVLMALYFAADHVVWAYQIGLVTDKVVGERMQKISLWSWALGSVCGVVSESTAIVRLSKRREGESEEQWAAREESIRGEVNTRLLALVHGIVQALTAAGLLQVLPFKPRTVGALGTIASAINCYMLLPPFPKKATALKLEAKVA